MIPENLKYFKTTIRCPSCRRKLAEKGYYVGDDGEEACMIEVKHKGFTALSFGLVIKCISCNNSYYITPDNKNTLPVKLRSKSPDGSESEL